MMPEKKCLLAPACLASFNISVSFYQQHRSPPDLPPDACLCGTTPIITRNYQSAYSWLLVWITAWNVIREPAGN